MPPEQRPDFEYEGMRGHRVVIEFDGFVSAKLICPDDGTCSPGEGESSKPTDECWLKTWFDNNSADELLHGKVEVAVDVDWDMDHPVVTLVDPDPAALSPGDQDA